MADRKPVKVLPDGGGDSAGLAEFVAADTIGIVDGGTGLATVAASNILTGNGTSALSAESNLTFDGSTLAVTGSMTLSSTSTISGDMTFVDNAKVTLGTGGDADLSYNGADTILLTSVAGTGGLGIGTAPDLMVQDGVHIKTGDSGASANVHADELIVEGSANAGMNILSGTSSTGRIVFSDSGAHSGAVVYAHAANSLAFQTLATERMLISNAGDVTVSTGDLVMGTSGKGIDFSATSDSGPGTTGSEVLNDYEEGTWTGAMTLGSGSATFNASYNTGNYTKVGRLVTLTGAFLVGSVTTPGGSLTITGLPFGAGGSGGDYEYRAAGAISNYLTTGDLDSLGMFIGEAGSLMYIQSDGDNTMGANIQVNTEFRFSITYTTAAI